jgi:hypothetical protein
MKRFFIISALVVSLMFSSCASSESKEREKREAANPEIGEATVKGGQKVAIMGYSNDPEMNKKMKVLDLEIADCYKQFTPIGKAAEMTINFNIVIDESGFIEKAAFKHADPAYNKIAGCISNDMKELAFRPGELREVSYRLVFKPVKEKKKIDPDDKRSKMILSLAEMKRFRVCYEEQIAKTPGIGGNFTIKFILTEDGRAEDIKIAGNTFNDPKVPLCVVKKLSEMAFPEGDAQDYVEVNFKFVSSTPSRGRKSMDIDM